MYDEHLVIGFSTPRKFGILSTTIRKIERTEFSHVYFKIFSKSLDRYLIYQASGLQVNFVGEDNFHSKNKTIASFIIPISTERKIKFLQKAIDLAGRPYGIKQIFGMGLVRFLYIFNYKAQNPYADGSHTYVCSELAAEHLNDLGFDFEDLDSITPKNIYNKLRNN